ncbi:aspartate aminotransferase family protein [Vicingaceae bacterium]|nr:aspartate aminotransferase family protein [Vicingaceae bacterium]MDC1451163.1 aspartate aminotransferase family protein [Vicingaceae bacterium]
MSEPKDFFKQHLAQTTPFPFGVKVDHAKGSYIYDTEGKAYLDLISGVAVSALGHGHPKILEAIKIQSEKHLHLMVYGEFEQDAQNDLAKELLKTLPESIDAFYFMNSGTEAIEAALKLAKRVTGNGEIIAFENAYHGSTHGALSLSSNEKNKAPFEPLLPQVKHIELNNLEYLNRISKETACVILETIQGDAGVRFPSKKYLQALRKKCDDTCTLLIFDEIQCGMGRTGKMWAFEHYGVVPDLLVAGKALGGGMPIGCLMANRKLMLQFSENPMLGHITTFGGHPLVCATAAAGLKVIREEQLLNALPAKAQLFEELLQHQEIKEVRQLGLMMAIELENEEKVQQVVLKGLEKGVLLFWFLSTPNAFRLAPPLNISEQEIREGCLTILELLNDL